MSFLVVNFLKFVVTEVVWFSIAAFKTLIVSLLLGQLLIVNKNSKYHKIRYYCAAQLHFGDVLHK